MRIFLGALGRTKKVIGLNQPPMALDLSRSESARNSSSLLEVLHAPSVVSSMMATIVPSEMLLLIGVMHGTGWRPNAKVADRRRNQALAANPASDPPGALESEARGGGLGGAIGWTNAFVSSGDGSQKHVTLL